MKKLLVIALTMALLISGCSNNSSKKPAVKSNENKKIETSKNTKKKKPKGGNANNTVESYLFKAKLAPAKKLLDIKKLEIPKKLFQDKKINIDSFYGNDSVILNIYTDNSYENYLYDLKDKSHKKLPSYQNDFTSSNVEAADASNGLIVFQFSKEIKKENNKNNSENDIKYDLVLYDVKNAKYTKITESIMDPIVVGSWMQAMIFENKVYYTTYNLAKGDVENPNDKPTLNIYDIKTAKSSVYKKDCDLPLVYNNKLVFLNEKTTENSDTSEFTIDTTEKKSAIKISEPASYIAIGTKKIYSIIDKDNGFSEVKETQSNKTIFTYKRFLRQFDSNDNFAFWNAVDRTNPVLYSIKDDKFVILDMLARKNVDYIYNKQSIIYSIYYEDGDNQFYLVNKK